MAIPANTLRMSFIGKIGLTDVWNCSVWIRPTGDATAPTNAADTAALLATFTGVSGWSSFRTALLTNMRPIDTIDEYALYSYPTGGTTAAAVAIQADGAVGTGTTTTNPPQICQVMTLQTGVAGRSHRGRIYWPATALAVNTANEQFSGTLSSTRSGFAGWVLGLAGLTHGWAPYVVSQTNTSSLPVLSVKVDTKPDVQRRRVNKMVPATVAVTNTPWL
jgi:hypothetical protein